MHLFKVLLFSICIGINAASVRTETSSNVSNTAELRQISCSGSTTPVYVNRGYQVFFSVLKILNYLFRVINVVFLFLFITFLG